MMRRPLLQSRSGWISLPGSSAAARSWSTGKIAMSAAASSLLTGIWNGMPSTSACRPRCRPSLRGIPNTSDRAVELGEDQRIGVLRGVAAHEDVEMPIAGDHVKGVVAGTLSVEPFVRAALTLRQEAQILRAGEEGHTRIGRRDLRGEVRRQSGAPLHGDEMSLPNALRHLREEGQRDVAELSPQ